MTFITFVSAFLDLEEDRNNENLKTTQTYFNNFEKLASSGISICLFSSEKYMNNLKEICKFYSNIYLEPFSINLFDTWVSKRTKEVNDLLLPEIRSNYKDTYNYMIAMNSKIDFIELAIKLNPFNTTHFAWIDFGICHIIKSNVTLENLYNSSKNPLKEKILAFPGCWEKDFNINFIYKKICWRFCGGFFIGDKDSLLNFINCYKKYYVDFLKEKKVLVWEVNFWAWLEYNGYFSPYVYNSLHDDKMLYFY
jgi:hypothetical protein